MASAALELVFVFVVGQWRFAGGTGQDFQQIAVDHNNDILAPVFFSGLGNRAARHVDSQVVTANSKTSRIGFSITYP